MTIQEQFSFAFGEQRTRCAIRSSSGGTGCSDEFGSLYTFSIRATKFNHSIIFCVRGWFYPQPNALRLSPVLSLKALHLANHRDHARRDALWYTAGVVVTFVLIAAVLIALRATGAALGWGFQLQNPILIGLLALLFVAIALNLSGVLPNWHVTHAPRPRSAATELICHWCSCRRHR